MPKAGVVRGRRVKRWSVDLSPAEWVVVDLACGTESRPSWLVRVARKRLENALRDFGDCPEMEAVQTALDELTEEELDWEEEIHRGARGGRRPGVRP